MNSRNPKLISFGALLGFLLLTLLSFGSQKPSAGKTSNQPPAAPPSQPIVQQQVQPAPPLPEQMPATAPQVTFKSGELTIVARNSSLGAILQDVETQTGASIDMPGTPSDRVVGQFGPGPAREVLASLLNGSHFNYVLLGSPQNPNALERVVLIAKSSAPEDTTPPPQAASAFPSALPRQGTFVAPTDDSDDTSSQDNSDDMTAQDQSTGDQAADQNNGDLNAQPAIKTPQQLLQELQRQRQVQQQGGAQGTPPQLPGPQVK
ncbi:MAG: hypothetical protein ACRD2S_02575 [Terriglobales bacterium]